MRAKSHHYKHWTVEELRYIRAAVKHDVPVDEIAATLGRVPGATNTQIVKLGLRGRSNHDWTDEERATLRIGWESGVSTKEIAVELGRTPGGIRAQADRLQLNRPGSVFTPPVLPMIDPTPPPAKVATVVKPAPRLLLIPTRCMGIEVLNYSNLEAIAAADLDLDNFVVAEVKELKTKKVLVLCDE